MEDCTLPESEEFTLYNPSDGPDHGSLEAERGYRPNYLAGTQYTYRAGYDPVEEDRAAEERHAARQTSDPVRMARARGYYQALAYFAYIEDLMICGSDLEEDAINELLARYLELVKEWAEAEPQLCQPPPDLYDLAGYDQVVEWEMVKEHEVCTRRAKDWLERVLREIDKRDREAPTFTPFAQPAAVDVIERARRYLATRDPAISGSGGHNQTISTAGKLVRGFGLTPEQAYPLLAAWNETCLPPWNEKELRHKLMDAEKTPDPNGRPRGYLLNDRSPVDGAAVVHGATIAESFLKNGAAGQAEQATATATPPRERFPLVTSKALDEEEYAPRWIIVDVLCALVPTIIGGLYKTCKTLVAIDQAIAIATGRPFLNVFSVSEPLTVLYFIGEGGSPTAQEYARRIARNKGLELGDVGNLYWCFSVPQLESAADLAAMVKVIDDTGAEVVYVDNLMLAMSGDEAGNVMKMGHVLQEFIRICGERGVTPIIIHHFKRTRLSAANPYTPGELSDLTQAGAAEIAGQWVLLTRREEFDADNAGEHKLWLSIGGRLVDPSVHALDVHEGRRKDEGGRVWWPTVQPAKEARQEIDGRKDEAKRQRKAERAAATLEADRWELVKVATRLKDPQTKTVLRDSSFGGSRFNAAFASLCADGTLHPVQIEKAGRLFEGWRLRQDDNPEASGSIGK